MRNHLGNNIPNVYDIARNVSFTLQNGHASVSYPRPLLPNVAEVACIHCRPAKPLPKVFRIRFVIISKHFALFDVLICCQDLEDFVAGSGESGFIYVSMGSSVKVTKMPEQLKRLMIETFAQLPYRVLWKWESGLSELRELPSNVKTSRWLPQQDILGENSIVRCHFGEVR